MSPLNIALGASATTPPLRFGTSAYGLGAGVGAGGLGIYNTTSGLIFDFTVGQMALLGASNPIISVDNTALRFGTGVAGAETVRITSQGNVGIGTTTPIAALQVTNPTINETGASNSITRGIYVSPNPLGTANVLQANDYRALETSGYTLVLASTTQATQIYGSLFNQQTINTTTVATLANASNVYINGAPKSTSNLTITSSTALTIIGGTVSSTTNAYGLFATAPIGAANNYSGVFTGGNFGVGTTTPSGVMHVVGQCVTGDTKLRRRRRRRNKDGDEEDVWEEVEIKDIKPGDEILTLDEKTGKLVPSKVLQLADMGVKDIFKLTTAGGRSIRTTGNHPYLARERQILSGSFEVDQSERIEDLAVDSFVAIAADGFSTVVAVNKS